MDSKENQAGKKQTQDSAPKSTGDHHKIDRANQQRVASQSDTREMDSEGNLEPKDKDKDKESFLSIEDKKWSEKAVDQSDLSDRDEKE